MPCSGPLLRRGCSSFGVSTVCMHACTHGVLCAPLQTSTPWLHILHVAIDCYQHARVDNCAVWQAATYQPRHHCPALTPPLIPLHTVADILKFYGCVLGAQTHFDKSTGTSIVNGNHDQDKLTERLGQFTKM